MALAAPNWFRFRVLVRALITVAVLVGSVSGVVSMLDTLLLSTLTSLVLVFLVCISLIGGGWFLASLLFFGRPLGLSFLLGSYFSSVLVIIAGTGWFNADRVRAFPF